MLRKTAFYVAFPAVKMAVKYSLFLLRPLVFFGAGVSSSAAAVVRMFRGRFRLFGHIYENRRFRPLAFRPFPALRNAAFSLQKYINS